MKEGAIAERHDHLVSLGLLLLTCATGCAAAHRLSTYDDVRAACAAGGDCSRIKARTGATLDPKERCQVALLRARCNLYDRCVLRCILERTEADRSQLCTDCVVPLVPQGPASVMCPEELPDGWETCSDQ